VRPRNGKYGIYADTVLGAEDVCPTKRTVPKKNCTRREQKKTVLEDNCPRRALFLAYRNLPHTSSPPRIPHARTYKTAYMTYKKMWCTAPQLIKTVVRYLKLSSPHKTPNSSLRKATQGSHWVNLSHKPTGQHVNMPRDKSVKLHHIARVAVLSARLL